MYCDFFGLRCRPFEDRADPHFYYPTAETEEAIAVMEYEAHYGRGLALILGESGTGKTLLARTLLQRLPATDHLVILTCPGNGAIDLVRETCKGFGVTLPSTPNAGRCLARLRRHLERTRKDDHRSILILDQAENLTTDGLTQLTTLCDLPRDGAPLLRIILCAQPRFHEIVSGPEFARFRQQMCGERTLPSLSRAETDSYVRHRQRVAGGGDRTLFDAEAITILHQASKGVPRLVSYYADAAMLAAYAGGERLVSVSLAMEVTTQGTQRQRTLDARELGLPAVSEVASGITPRTPRRVAPGEPLAADGATTSEGESPIEHSSPRAFDAEREAAASMIGNPSDSLVTMVSPPTANSTLSDHETLLCRLEAAIARAERTVSTTDAGVAKYAAIEQHLLSITVRAERAAGLLAGSVERAGDAADRVQRRFEQTVADAENRTKLLESQTAGTVEAATAADQAGVKLDHTREQAEHARTRLTSFTEQLADKAEELQDRVSEMMNAVAASDRTRQRIESLLQHAPTTTENLENRLSGLQARINQVFGEADGKLQAFADERLDRIRGGLGEDLERIEQTRGDLVRRAESTAAKIAAETASVAEKWEQREDAVRAALGRATAEMERIQNEVIEKARSRMSREIEDPLDDRLRTARNTLDEIIDRNGTRLRQLVDQYQSQGRAVVEATAKLDELRPRIEQIDDSCRRCDELAISCDQLSGELTGLEGRAADLPHQLHSGQEMVDNLSGRVETIRAQITPVMEEGEKLLVELLDARTQMASVRTAINDTLAELGAVHRDAGELRKDARAWEDLLTRLAENRSHAEVAFGRLELAGEGAGRQIESLTRIAADAADERRRAEEQTRAAGQANASLGAQIETATSARTAIETSMAKAGEQQNTIEKLAEQLRDLRGSANGLVRQLEELIISSGQSNDAAQITCAAVEQKLGQLDSHLAAATHALRDLSDANVTGGATIQRLEGDIDRIQQITHDSLEQVEQLGVNSQEITAYADQQLQHLRTQTTCTGEFMERVAGVRAAAEPVLTELKQALVEGKRYSATIAGQVAEAGVVADRLSGLTQLLQRAEASEAAVRQTADHAATILEGMEAAIGSSTRTADSLHEIQSGAHQVLVDYAELKGELETTAQRLHEQLTRAEGSIQNREPLLHDFTERTRKLEEHLSRLGPNVEDLERAVQQATERPREIVQAAQNQAEQLEQVCSAVRKVFSSLSKTSLEAARQTTEFQKISDGAATRLAHLRAETERAQATLREWVEEAIRAQTRIEKALSHLPTVQETHPGEALRGMARLLDSEVDAGDQEPAVEGSAEGAMALDEPPIVQRVFRPRTRTDEIAALIEDARRASEQQPEIVG